ncbi:HdeD family acid-resistance protein [Actinokineospora bangkokensis]|uniref:HdeD family acid-resistance protein n=1 Tax=Actinokineospora bangkokensis TaxID=1193682 RepID=A0A1Q9LBS9_9PSEU|nr:DUF308 domain-containing protein [Actinokineospora bangkokensis]OLR89463.1 hypothetical protein BJP25_05070 [Actinokineospora bangkokensis]
MSAAFTITPGAQALHRLTARWWVPVLLGFLVAVLGVLLIGNLATAAGALAVLVAIGLIFDGAAELATAGRHHQGWPAYVLGGLWLLVGVLALVWPGLTLLALATFVGVGFLLGGVVQVAAAIRARKRLPMWGLWLALGVLTAVAGVLALVLPGLTILTLALFLGIALLLRGIGMVWFGFSLRRVHNATR